MAAGIGRRIAAAREHAGLSRAALARACGVDSRTVYRWEHGEAEPRGVAQIETLGSTLGVDIGWLVTGVGDVPFVVPDEAEDDDEQDDLEPTGTAG